VIISYPNGITEVEKKAITISAMRAGARKVYLVPEPLAAAVGVGFGAVSVERIRRTRLLRLDIG
jgi:actin-like ATPase involved in cell morphogenesis